jgi:hypothetical protein
VEERSIMNKFFAVAVAFVLAFSASVWGQGKTVADETKLVAQNVNAPPPAYTDVRPGEPSGTTMDVSKPFPAGMGPKVAQRPDIKAGDWVFRRKANGQTGRLEVKEVRPDGTMIVMLGKKPAIFTTSWDLIDGYGGKTGDPVSYSPAFPNLQFPLATGNTWQATIAWTSGRFNGTTQVKAVVGDWTKVTVGEKVVNAIVINYDYDDGTKTSCLYSPEVPWVAVTCTSNNSTYAFSIEKYGTAATQKTATQ